jgi:hypothetical protein
MASILDAGSDGKTVFMAGEKISGRVSLQECALTFQLSVPDMFDT